MIHTLNKKLYKRLTAKKNWEDKKVCRVSWLISNFFGNSLHELLIIELSILALFIFELGLNNMSFSHLDVGIEIFLVHLNGIFRGFLFVLSATNYQDQNQDKSNNG